MYDKKIFETLLIGFLKSEPYIKSLGLIDNEGLPIAIAIKSKKYKIAPNKLSSSLQQALYPLVGYQKALNCGMGLLQVYILEDGCLFLINLGVASLGILFDFTGWPLNQKTFLELLNNLQKELQKASNVEDGLLSKISGDENRKLAIDLISADNINKLGLLMQSLSEGKMEPISMFDDPKGSTFFSDICNKNDCMIINEDKEGIAASNTYSLDFVGISSEIIEIQMKGMQQFDSGQYLASVSYFNSGYCIANSLIGTYNSKKILMFKFFNNFSIGFKSIISPFNAISEYIQSDYGNDEVMNFNISLSFINEPVEKLREKINEYTKNKLFNVARQFMDRVAIMYSRDNNYVGAGDIYKMIALTLYREGDITKSINYYEEAIEFHKKTDDHERIGLDYRDMADILKRAGRISDVLDNYAKAEQEFRSTNKLNLVENVQTLKQALYKECEEKLTKFVKESTGVILTLNFISEKTLIDEILIGSILKQLIRDRIIEGELDIEKGRYSKVKGASAETVSKPVQAAQINLPTNNQPQFAAQSVQNQPSLEIPSIPKQISTSQPLSGINLNPQTSSSQANNNVSMPEAKQPISQNNVGNLWQNVNKLSKEMKSEEINIDNVYMVDGDPKYFDIKKLDDSTFISAIYSVFPSELYQKQMNKLSENAKLKLRTLKMTPMLTGKLISDYFDYPNNLKDKLQQTNSSEVKICPVCGTRNMSSSTYCSKDNIKLIF